MLSSLRPCTSRFPHWSTLPRRRSSSRATCPRFLWNWLDLLLTRASLPVAPLLLAPLLAPPQAPLVEPLAPLVPLVQLVQLVLLAPLAPLALRRLQLPPVARARAAAVSCCHLRGFWRLGANHQKAVKQRRRAECRNLRTRTSWE